MGNGQMRLNLCRDFDQTIENIEAMKTDLEMKGTLIRKIYKFERQMFLIQGKISGKIPSTQDLTDEIDAKDGTLKPLVMLDDVNYRLKEYIKF